MTTDNEKATAKILLSTDEAVVEKIRRVLMQHPEIVFDVMRQREEYLMMQKRQEEYNRHLQQSMLNQNTANQYTYRTYQTDNTNPIGTGMTLEQWLGGKK